jgi:MFS family permease
LLVGLLGVEFVVIGALDLLFVVMAVDVLDAGEEWAGYLNTAFGVGALVLGALAALLVGRRIGPVIVGTALVLGLAVAATAVAGLAVVVVLLAVAGGMKSLFDVGVRVLLQRSVPPHRTAGIFGAAEGLSMLGLGVGSILVPLLVSWGGPELAVYGTAALLPLAVVLQVAVLLRIDEKARVPVVELALLGQVPIFGVLPGDTLEGLALQLERVAFEPGQDLVRQGDTGDSYFVIAQGEVEVLQDDVPIRRLGRADGLGEIALLRTDRRTATARATTPVTAFKLARDPFLSAVTSHHPTLDAVHAAVRAHEDRDAGRDPNPPRS